VQALEAAGEELLLVCEGSLWQKPESLASQLCCVVGSAKARRLSRRRTGLSIAHKRPPFLLPALHWQGLLSVAMATPPTLAQLQCCSRPGAHASSPRAFEQALLEGSARQWRRQLRHSCERGSAGSGWMAAALAAGLRFVLRWKKGQQLLDSWGQQRKACQSGRGKRSIAYPQVRDSRRKELSKVGVLVIALTVVEQPQALLLIRAGLGKRGQPW
jgi:hypothetical protein